MECRAQIGIQLAYNTRNFRAKEREAGLEEYSPETKEMAQGAWYLLILVEWFGPSLQAHKADMVGQNVGLEAGRMAIYPA